MQSSTQAMIDEVSDADDLRELRGQLTLERRAEIMLRLARPGAAARPLARSGFGRREPEQLLLVDGLAQVGTAEAAFALGRLAEATEWSTVRAAVTTALEGRFEGGDDQELFTALATRPHLQRDSWSACLLYTSPSPRDRS